MERLSPGRVLAELAVIVLGVLIALGAENQWSNLQGRIAAREYLERLSVEVSANQSSLDDDVAWWTQACASAQATLGFLSTPTQEVEADELLRFVVSAAMHGTAGYTRVTYDDLVGTGHLSLIDDPALRESLVASYGTAESQEVWRPRVDDPFRTTVLRTLPFEYVQRVLTECVQIEGTMRAGSTLRDCTAAPIDGDAATWLSDLVRQPELRADLSERVYHVCRFDDQLAPVRTEFETLAHLLEAAIQ